MTTFDQRKDAYENKFARDEELRFKAAARRNRLLGAWAAKQLGLSPTEAEAYTRDVVRADMQEAGDDDVIRKLRADFDRSGVQESDHQIRRMMEELMTEAIRQIETKSE